MKKIHEDIQQGEYLSDLPEEVYDYMSEANLDGKPFYIIWDISEIEKILGTDGDRSVTEDILTDVLGDNWGYEDDWRMCDSCGKALYYMDGDYWIDYDNGETVCSDCLSEHQGYQMDYIDHLMNNYEECNNFISDDTLRSFGWIKLDGVYANDYYGHSDSPRAIMDRLNNEYPQANFLFSSESNGAWGCSWSVWVDRDLEDEEEVSDEER